MREDEGAGLAWCSPRGHAPGELRLLLAVHRDDVLAQEVGLALIEQRRIQHHHLAPAPQAVIEDLAAPGSDDHRLLGS